MLEIYSQTKGLLFYTNIKSPLTDHDLFVSPQHLDEKSPAAPSQSNSHTY